MCGINGIFAYNTPALAPSEVELMASRDAMKSRGPDGAGIWWSRDRRCAFGHRRLSVLDLSSAGAQPMASADGNLVVSFNGEIYNYRELRRSLEARGAIFRSFCDTEVLLHLYALEGPGMVYALRGMFAMAIWDERRHQLFLARDPYGIKPLYYANDGWVFRFASQVKGLLAGGAISRDPEPAGIVGFHLWGHVPEPFTIYRDVRAVPAGHTMLIDRLGPREPKPYWAMARVLASARLEPDRGRRAALLAEGVRDSVRHHLLADVEVGVFLSAGIDSGALLGLVRDAGPRPVRCVTLSFAEFYGTAEDETPLARIVAAQYGAEHLVRTVDETEFRHDLPNILAAMDQPSIDGVNTWFVAKAAREAGLKVALSGLGGDELLGGYPSFVDLPRWRNRYGILGMIPGVGKLWRLLISNFLPGLVSRRPKAAHFLEHVGTLEGAYLLRRGLFLPGELARMLDPDMVSEGLRRLRPLSRLRGTVTPDPGSETARVCALESCHYLRDQLLRDADWAGMAHGLEIRTPLVDSALLRRLAPAIHGFAPGEGKRALAAAPSTHLPASMIDRPKTGFGVPTGAWTGAAASCNGGDATGKGPTSRAWSRLVYSRSKDNGGVPPACAAA